MAALAALALAACSDPEPATVYTGSICDTGAQCAQYTLPASWPVDVRANCEAAGGTYGGPGTTCPAASRQGSCLCEGAGSSTTTWYYPPYDPAQAASSCAGLPACTFAL